MALLYNWRTTRAVETKGCSLKTDMFDAAITWSMFTEMLENANFKFFVVINV